MEDDADSPLQKLDGQIDIIHAASFFHLFSWDEQVRVAERVVRLLRARPGSLLLGRQVGNVLACEHAGPAGSRRAARFRHDEGSWERMWAEVGRRTGTRWKVEAALDRSDDYFRDCEAFRQGHPAGTRRLRFAVRRE